MGVVSFRFAQHFAWAMHCFQSMWKLHWCLLVWNVTVVTGLQGLILAGESIQKEHQCDGEAIAIDIKPDTDTPEPSGAELEEDDENEEKEEEKKEDDAKKKKEEEEAKKKKEEEEAKKKKE